MTTVVPPEVGPDVTLKPVTIGTSKYVYTSEGVVAEVPWLVVTVTWTGPATPAGAVARISVVE